MKVGDAAELGRRFEPEDIRGFVAIAGGDADAISTVPEPLIAALFSRLLGVDLPGPGTNYLKQELTYLAPVPLSSELTARVEITRLRPEKHLCDLATTLVDATGRRLVEGRALVSIRDVAGAPAEAGG